MSLPREQSEELILSMKTVTWQKDSHSLFDYEFNKNVNQNTFQFSLAPKFIFIFRNNTNSQVNLKEKDIMEIEVDRNEQLLGCIQLRQENKKMKLDFFNAAEVKVRARRETGESLEASGSNIALDNKEEDIFLIVRSLKNKNNQNKGYKLNIGQVIKLGRVQYLITSINNNFQVNQNKTKFWSNNKKIIVESLNEIAESERECKYCMLGESTQYGEFLCSPCKCSGSCGLVHFKCLEKWNQSKVKKEVVGGTIQYNFQKFFCEVCKEQYPRFIQKDKTEYELMPIEKPPGHHLMLEGISEKANNMMVIQNVPHDGIKLGRGHQCEIRITDISVSRNHSKIEKIGDDYYIFDIKSKFGTLVKEERLSLQLNKIKQGIQIGRTVITFEKSKKLI